MEPFRFPAPIYPIVDADDRWPHAPLDQLDAMLQAGVPLVQLRVKRLPVGAFVELARAARARTAAAGSRLIINDRVDVALLVEADGVHLGQDDLPPEAARALLGPGTIVGFSTHNLDQALRAAAHGVADYIGFGPVFATSTKENPDPVVGLAGLADVRRAVALPIVAIGGIGRAEFAAARAAGADAVAMIGAIVGAADIAGTLRDLLAGRG